jgi:transposase
MRQPSRTFTQEFKQEAVRLLETSGKSGMALAKELGISDSVLYRWRKELRANGTEAFPGKGHQTELEEEVRRLRRENDPTCVACVPHPMRLRPSLSLLK